VTSAVGRIPKQGSINLSGLDVDWEKLFSMPKSYWQEDIKETRKFLDEQVGSDLPEAIVEQINQQEARIAAMP
jgi:phosphoenolpyruvate carboxykinase (GTP)